MSRQAFSFRAGLLPAGALDDDPSTLPGEVWSIHV